MIPVVNFIELENRVISAAYRNLMVQAKIVIIEKSSGEQLSDPITTIRSPVPSGVVRIRLPDTVKPGSYYLKALNGHGEPAARSVEFYIS